MKSDDEVKREKHLGQSTPTGETPYACQICQKKFTVEQNLIQHVLTHETSAEVKSENDEITLVTEIKQEPK